MDSGHKRFGFSSQFRLETKAQFQAVFSHPLKSNSAYFTVLGHPNGKSIARLGVVVAKRYSKRAPDRNRIKRCVRESFRRHKQELVGLDLVVVARITRVPKGSVNIRKCLENHWNTIVRSWKNG